MFNWSLGSNITITYLHNFHCQKFSIFLFNFSYQPKISCHVLKLYLYIILIISRVTTLISKNISLTLFYNYLFYI